MAHTLMEIGCLGAEATPQRPWMPALLRFLQTGLGVRLRPYNPSRRPVERVLVLGAPGQFEIPPTVRIVLYLPAAPEGDLTLRSDWIEPGPIPVFGTPRPFPRLGELPWRYMGGGAPVSWANRGGQTLLQVGFDPLTPLAHTLMRQPELGHADGPWNHTTLEALPPDARHLALTPWVDRLLRLLARLLDVDAAQLPAPLPRWPGGASWAACLSHDVDMLFKWRLRSVVRLLLESPLHALDSRGVLLAKRWRELWLRLRTGRDPWFLVDEVVELERSHGMMSTLLFLAEPRDPQSFRYHLGRAQVRGLLARLRDQSVEIGLHGGWSAYNDAHRMRAQARRLESLLGRKPELVRQHWLRFHFPSTWKAQMAAGLQVDSSLGFNDRPGFRAGTSLPFHPLDQQGQALPLLELPLLLMDSQLYDEQGLTPLAARRQADDLVEQVRRVGGLLTVNWHPHTLCREDFPGRREHYESLLERLDQDDCWVGGMGMVAGHWRSRAQLLEDTTGAWEETCASL